MSAIRLTKQQRLRAELEHLRARYDGGQVSPAVYQIIKELETRVAWIDHHRATEQDVG
jgi:hypothetical protein